MRTEGVMIRIVIILLLLLRTSGACLLPVEPETTENSSGNGRYVLKVVPGNWPDDLGSCKGMLYEVHGKSRKMLWKRNLVNDRAPVDVYVPDSGKYVVTLGGWNHGITCPSPLVIYNGSDGKLAGIVNPRHLLTEKELSMRQENVTFWFLWYRSGLVFFAPEDELLFITLSSGRVVALDLLLGSIAREDSWKKHEKWVNSQIEKLCLERLKSSESEERESGAFVAGVMKIQKAIPLLRALLDDKSTCHTKLREEAWKKVYHVRKAAVKALDLLGIEVKGVVTEEVIKEE